MVYKRTIWRNTQPPALNEANLNKIEVGIEDAHLTADKVRSDFDEHIAIPDAHHHKTKVQYANVGYHLFTLTTPVDRTSIDISALVPPEARYAILWVDINQTPAVAEHSLAIIQFFIPGIVHPFAEQSVVSWNGDRTGTRTQLIAFIRDDRHIEYAFTWNPNVLSAVCEVRFLGYIEQ